MPARAQTPAPVAGLRMGETAAVAEAQPEAAVEGAAPAEVAAALEAGVTAEQPPRARRQACPPLTREAT